MVTDRLNKWWRENEYRQEIGCWRGFCLFNACDCFCVGANSFSDNSTFMFDAYYCGFVETTWYWRDCCSDFIVDAVREKLDEKRPQIWNKPPTASVPCRDVDLRGRPDGNALLCKRTVCIILADRPHGAWKRTFFKPVLGVEKSENAALTFSNLHTFWDDDAMAPPLHLWTPQRLITTTTTTTTMAFYMLVFVSRSSSLTSLTVHKRFWFPCTRHSRLLLLVFGFSFYCLFVYSAQLSAHAPSLLLKYSWNDAEEDGGKKDRFPPCGRALSFTSRWVDWR